MTESHNSSTETQRNILEYLKTLRLRPGSLDIEVSGAGRTGCMHVTQGRVIAAECGKLQGNGALLTLVSIGSGDIQAVKAEESFASNVSISVPQVERFIKKLPNFSSGESHCDEELTFHDAVQLFFQFRRKEAGAKLVEVLRSNRFYYPAWLWHSRLMTREDYIKKALNEAKKWGNVDPSIKREVEKIEPKLNGSAGMVKRCIYCWSLLRSGQERCDNCRGLQRLSKSANDERHVSGELQQTLSLYEDEMLKNPDNARIAYCLCLGFSSLGKIDRAREFINKALNISPREPLFVKASALLNPVQKEAKQELAQKVAVHQEKAEKVVPVVPEISSSTEDKSDDKTEQTVLVVEDSKTARKVVSLVLGRKGYNIIEATTGTEALLAIEGVTPDLVLLDVMLPDMDGYEILSTIRKNKDYSDVPVIMLTGKKGAADRQKGMVSGSNEYLTKPFNPAKLLSVIGKYLNKSAKNTQTAQPNYVTKKESPVPHVKPAPVVKSAIVAPAEVKPAIVTPAEVKPAVITPKVVKPEVVKVEVAKPKETAQDRLILVVEDSPTSRKVITMVLTRKGYVVSEAATGGEAFSKVKEELPKLILLDAMLPDMSGYDILAQFKQDPRLKDIPVVMLTAKDSPVDRQKGMQAGSSAYLTKPFNPDKLLSVIGGYI